ncbi:MAG: GTPase Era [bacterium]
MQEGYKSGFVAILGRPNVGKSTLLNRLVGQKVAIMSDKPQTTRNKIQAVITRPDAQIVLLDTPGVHKPKHKLGSFMLSEVQRALEEVDAVLLVLDATEKIGAGDRYVVEQLSKINTPVFLLLNKVDLLKKEKLPDIIRQAGELGDFTEILPLAAKTGLNVELLVDKIVEKLPYGPQYYPEDMVTDQPERLIIGEMVREKALHLTRDEVPHAIAVEVEEVTKRPNKDLVYVQAVIYVERDSQKGIIVGKNGSMLKKIGRLAREDIEKLLGNRIYLDLWVKVKDDWRNRDGCLKSLGYDE